MEASWQALQDAKKIYGMIAQAQDPTIVPETGAHRGEGAAVAPVDSDNLTEMLKELKNYHACGVKPPNELILAIKRHMQTLHSPVVQCELDTLKQKGHLPYGSTKKNPS